MALQLGHAGRKGSTRRAWDGIDMPLNDAERDGPNWPLLAPSAVPYMDGVSQVPHEMTRADMDAVLAEFESAARRGVEAGFDWLELHCAHGYLLSGFISPLTNLRKDELRRQLRESFALSFGSVCSAMRKIWPQDKTHVGPYFCARFGWKAVSRPTMPLQIAKQFKAAGADFVDCSSGQVDKREKPVYGRMFQTPFADRIRNEAGVRTIAVGAISEADHVNSIIAAGRADLCAVARPHLANPSWTMQEAARSWLHRLELAQGLCVWQASDGNATLRAQQCMLRRKLHQPAQAKGAQTDCDTFAITGAGPRHWGCQ
jgi:anthraniloyl-CoA monooxygenase